MVIMSMNRRQLGSHEKQSFLGEFWCHGGESPVISVGGGGCRGVLCVPD
jgi:hypothetical protein